MSVQGFNFGDGIVKYDYNHLDNAPIPEEMTVGSANQLISKLTETDKEPYLFRTAGGSLEIGDREKLTKIVGGSVAWNQLVQNGNFADGTTGWYTASATDFSVNDGVASFTPTAQYGLLRQNLPNKPLNANHVYLGSAKIKTDDASSNAQFVMGDNVNFTTGKTVTLNTSWQDVIIFVKPTTVAYTNYHIVAVRTMEESSWGTIYVKDVNLVDLTLLLTPTIADYIYTLETATAGSGIAKLKSWGFFTKDYYPYDAGSIKSVEGLSRHEMVGFNQFNKDVSYTGSSYRYWDVPIGEANRMYISFKDRGTTVDLSGINIGFCTTNTGRAASYVWNLSNGVIANNHSNITNAGDETGIYCKYMFMYPNTEDALNKLLSKYDICVNIHWDGERDDEYEPYARHSYALDDSLTLRGIPKLDSSGRLYYDGDTYESDGTVTRKYGIVDLGTLSWSYYTNNNKNYFVSTISGIKSALEQNIGNLLSSKYVTDTFYNMFYHTYDKTISVHYNTAQIQIRDASYTDATTFKTAMSGVYLVYELATPTTETADPYTETQIVDNWGTEEFVSTGIVPVGHETEYVPDLKAKLEVAPEAPNADGLYLMKRENGENSYVAYVPELPTDPAEDGTYTLKATKTSSGTALAWVADE